MGGKEGLMTSGYLLQAAAAVRLMGYVSSHHMLECPATYGSEQ